MTAQGESPDFDCSAVRSLCHPFLDRELEPAARDAVARHLPGCADCGRFYDEERVQLEFLQRALSAQVGAEAMPLQQKIRAALPQGTHAGGLLGGWRRLAIAASLFLAGSLLGFFTSVLVTAESRDRADQADLAMRVGMCCDLAREVLPDQRMHGGYEEAASALQAVFPGARLPKLAGQAVPSPRLFGTATMESSRMNWVVFCDGDPSMRQRFLLLTVESVGSEGVGLGLREMELEQGDLRVIVWRDEGFFRVLITQRELDWAREQRRALRIV